MRDGMELFWVEQQLRGHMGEVARGKGAGFGESQKMHRDTLLQLPAQSLSSCCSFTGAEMQRDETLTKPETSAHRERVVSTKHEMATEEL